MEEIAGSVYVGVFAVLPLDHGVAVLEVTGIPVMLDIRGSAIVFNVECSRRRAAGQCSDSPGSCRTTHSAPRT